MERRLKELDPKLRQDLQNLSCIVRLDESGLEQCRLLAESRATWTESPTAYVHHISAQGAEPATVIISFATIGRNFRVMLYSLCSVPSHAARVRDWVMEHASGRPLQTLLHLTLEEFGNFVKTIPEWELIW